MSPKTPPEKNKEREDTKSEEKERRRREEKAMPALSVFMLTSLEISLLLFEGSLTGAWASCARANRVLYLSFLTERNFVFITKN